MAVGTVCPVSVLGIPSCLTGNTFISCLIKYGAPEFSAVEEQKGME